MVQHGRNKKRKAGRLGQTKLKNRSWVRWNPKPKISDLVIRQQWDPSKSPTANLTQMGLLAKPNHTAESATVNNGVIELFDIPESDKPSRRTKFPLEQEEEAYIANCMAKWGDDYTRMFRDLKVNTLQHTEEKLRKMGARYLLLTPDQRRVEVPDRVKPLLLNNDCQ